MPMDEDAFLRAIAADPRDDNARLVYADWLEEHGGPAGAARAEFLRVTVELAAAQARKRPSKALSNRLLELALLLDDNWLAVVSHLKVENCPQGSPAYDRLRGLRFDLVCDRKWQEMRPTDKEGVRFCEGCQKDVHYCVTISTARGHARNGHCVAVDLRVQRREGDLEPIMMVGAIRPHDPSD
jgi:uncharacterized protein (TIGR02996 family)